MSEKSTVKYTLDSSLQLVSPINWPILEEGWSYNPATEQLISPSTTLVTQDKAQKYQKKADKFYERQQYTAAVRFYNKAIAAQKSEKIPQLYLQLSRSNLAMGKTLAAGEAIAPLLEKRRGDYRLHLLLSEIYQVGAQPRLEKYHLSLAHLYNRNDLEILARLRQLLQKQNLAYQDWDFVPGYEVVGDEKAVQVRYRERPWRAYGLCEAIWKNEPGYVEKMARISTQSPQYIQQKECLLSALIAYEQNGADANAFPGLAVLGKALSEDQIDGFILYEIESRKDPKRLLSLEDAELKKLLEYIEKYRCVSINR